MGASRCHQRAVDEASPDEEYMSYLPRIAVNKHGIVAVRWYDRREFPPARNWEADGWNVRLRMSVDGGATWSRNVQTKERAQSRFGR